MKKLFWTITLSALLSINLYSLLESVNNAQAKQTLSHSVSTPTSVTEKLYQAQCTHQSHGRGWYGPKRTDLETAKADAQEHNKYNSGHNATAVEIEGSAATFKGGNGIVNLMAIETGRRQ